MDGQDSGDTKQSTADMTQFVQTLLQQMQTRFQTMSESIVSKIDEMGERINELEQSINDLRTDMGAEGSPSPLSTSKKPIEPKTDEDLCVFYAPFYPCFCNRSFFPREVSLVVINSTCNGRTLVSKSPNRKFSTCAGSNSSHRNED